MYVWHGTGGGEFLMMHITGQLEKALEEEATTMTLSG